MYGKITSYNLNTFKGRIYIENLRRPISFDLAKDIRNSSSNSLLSQNMSSNSSVIAQVVGKKVLRCHRGYESRYG
ncbi:MAG: DUF7947 five-stranded beta-barrel domain-containing protein, partial [Alphaproteobacteria bacterium]